jgi:murein DD-endopeptidase MepM/ murein hydrolase activator NlpD
LEKRFKAGKAVSAIINHINPGRSQLEEKSWREMIMGEAALSLVTSDEVMKEVISIEDQAKALKIVSRETYIKAGELWKAIKAIRAKVAETFDGNIKKAHELHKSLVAEKKRHDGPLDEAERMVKRGMSDFDLEQERIRQAEQRRLEEIARKEAEERALLEAISAEEEAKRNGATKEEAKKEADAIIAEPVTVAPVVLPKATPKLQGGPVYRTVWKARIVNERLIPREYLTADMVKINGVVRSLKGATNIPGVMPYEERV